MLNEIVIFGTGKIAEVVYWCFAKDSVYSVAGFTVDERFISNACCMFGLHAVPFESVEETYPPDQYRMFVAVGYQELNSLRAAKCDEARNKGYRLASYVSTRASNLGDVRVGENCLVLENAVIQPGVEIGDDVFIWSGNHIGHHSSIGDHCYIAGHVVIGGSTIIGPRCFIGVNATIGHEVRIGADSIVGAGTLITKDVPAKSVFIARDTPRYRLESDAFLRLTMMPGMSLRGAE